MAVSQHSNVASQLNATSEAAAAAAAVDWRGETTRRRR